MSRTTRTGAGDEAALVESLRGEPCQWCGSGVLRPGEYKGDDALVCDDCDTPSLRFFS